MTANNILWKEWVSYSTRLRSEAAGMKKPELKERILQSAGNMTDEQRRAYLKKLRWKNKKKLTDILVESEYSRMYPGGI